MTKTRLTDVLASKTLPKDHKCIALHNALVAGDIDVTERDALWHEYIATNLWHPTRDHARRSDPMDSERTN